MAKNKSRTAGSTKVRENKGTSFVKKIKKAVVYITIGLIILFFYEAYFG